MGKGYIGTSGNDGLSIPFDSFAGSGIYAAALAGDDRILAGNQYRMEDFVSLYGGSGNDTYVLSRNSCVVVADASGTDTVELPFTMAEFNRYNPFGYSAIIDNAHYYLELSGVKLLVTNFAGEGKVENISFKDGAFSFDEMWSMYGHIAKTGTSNDLGPAMKQLFDQTMNRTGALAAQEHVSIFGSGDPGLAREVYFDEEQYLQNKADALNAYSEPFSQKYWSDTVRTAFQNAGMTPLQHFMYFGAFEKNAQGGIGIDPSAAFDVSAYFTAKAEQLTAMGQPYSAEGVAQAFQSMGLDPVTHFAAHGFAEGLAPQPVGTVGVQAMEIPAEDSIE